MNKASPCLFGILFALPCLTTWGLPVHRYCGEIAATITEASGGLMYEVGDTLMGRYSYSSESVDGTFRSDGNGNLKGYMLWNFPWDRPWGEEGRMVSDAELIVIGGQATSFSFGLMTDFSDYYFSGTTFSLIDEFGMGPQTASGTLAFGPIRCPDSGASALELLVASAALVVFHGRELRAKQPRGDAGVPD
jgi:hypothetical protein